MGKPKFEIGQTVYANIHEKKSYVSELKILDINTYLGDIYYKCIKSNGGNFIIEIPEIKLRDNNG